MRTVLYDFYNFAAFKTLMKVLFINVCLLITVYAAAQDSTMQILKSEAVRPIPRSAPDTIHRNWIKGGLFNLNIAQGSLKDWAAGGDNFTVTLNLYVNGHAFYKKGKISWDNNIDINLGYLNTTTLGTRKNDDRFDMLSKYGYALNKNVSLSALFNFRTQFFNGFSYPNDSTRVLTSSGLSPAYILLSPGFDFHPVKNLSIFISPFTSRWIIVGSPTLSKEGAYGVDSGKYASDEIGAFGTISYHTNLGKLVTYNTRLDLFSNYEHNAQDVDVYMTNLFAARLGKVITATWSVDMIYDDDVRIFGPNHDSPHLQLRSLVGLGVLFKLGM